MAQLKSTVVQGNLTVSGNINATKIIKHGGVSTEILMADGSVEKIDELDYIPLTGTNGVTGNITSSANISATLFDGPAVKLQTGRTLKVNLARTSASTAFDGTANITNIGVGGTLAVGNGGTGQTTAVNAANAFLNALSTGSSTPTDEDWYISQYVNGGTSTTTFHRRPVKHLYTYIQGKTDAVYVKLTGSTNITGKLKSSDNIEAAKFVGPLDGTAAKATADADGNTISSTYLKCAGGIMTGALGLNSHYLIKPVAEYRVKSGDTHNGMITITLPESISNTMVSMWIDVYNYRTNTSFSVHVGGYTYSNNSNNTNTWQHHPFAMIYGANHNVRLGHDGTSFVIYIGEKNSEWHYPQISVRDVILGYNPSYANWSKNWTISFTTTDPLNVTAEISNYVWTTKNFKPSNYIPLTGSSSITGDLKTSNSIEATGGFKGNLTGNVTGNVTGNASGNAGTATKLQTARTINGTNFDGSANITTARWGTARNITIGNETKSVNGSAAYNWTLAQIGAVNKGGDTMTGDLKMGSNVIHSKYYTITDGSTDKATYQYNSTDDCIELVFT